MKSWISTSAVALQLASNATAQSTALVETAIGAVAALAVLAFVFGSAIAIVPLLIAIPSILTTFLLVLGLAQAISVNFLVEYLVALMGLGVAIDYSLLLITRWREERESGRSNEEGRPRRRTDRRAAVVLSGAIVAVGLLSKVLLPVPFLRSIGLGGMLIPLVAIAAAVTLLPTMLAAWDRRSTNGACVEAPRRSVAPGNCGARPSSATAGWRASPALPSCWRSRLPRCR